MAVGVCLLAAGGASELAGTVFWSLQYVLFVNTFQLQVEYVNISTNIQFKTHDKLMLMLLIACGYLFTVFFWLWVCCLICVCALANRRNAIGAAFYRPRSVSRQLLSVFENLPNVEHEMARGNICAICIED